MLIAAATALAMLALGGFPAPSAAMTPGLGFSTFTEKPDDWEAIGKSGIHRYRIAASWAKIEAKGAEIGQNWTAEYAWVNTYDRYFTLAAKKNITLLPVLNGRKTGHHHSRFYGEWESEAWSEWFQFVWTFVQRYGHNGHFWAAHPSLPYRPVDVWQVWNEPNLAVNNPYVKEEACKGGKYEWPWVLYEKDDKGNEYGACVQPKNYARFFNATVNTINNAQQQLSATLPGILTGGINRDPAINPTAITKFLNTIATNTSLASQFQARYHALAIHPYANCAPTQMAKWEGMAGGVINAYEAQNAFAGTGKGIWLTEVGWPLHGTLKCESQVHVTEGEQATLLKDTFNWLTAWSANYNITAAFWYFYRDSADPAANLSWDHYAGLRTFDGRYRPAWYEFLKQTSAPTWPVAPNLRYILMNQTGSGKTEVHLVSGASGYSTYVGSAATVLHETSPSSWQFTVLDYNHDGAADVLAVAQKATGSKKTELHVINGATNYSSYLANIPTALGETSPSKWQLSGSDVDYDGKVDLVGVWMNGTPSGNTQVNVLDGATGYLTSPIQSTTPLGETNPSQWRFTPLDHNHDGAVDLMAIKMNGTASGKVEVTVLDGATAFQTVLGQYTTIISETTPSQFQFWGVDADGDDFGDLMAVGMNGTGTGKVEAHLLSGATGYSSFLVNGVTPWLETNANIAWFAPSIR